MIKIIRESNGELMGVLNDDESAYTLQSEVEELRSEVEQLRKIVSSGRILGSKVYRVKTSVVEAMQFTASEPALNIKCWLEARYHIKCEIKEGGLHTYLVITNSISGRRSEVQAGNYVVFDGTNVFIYDKHAFKEIFEEIV